MFIRYEINKLIKSEIEVKNKLIERISCIHTELRTIAENDNNKKTFLLDLNK